MTQILNHVCFSVLPWAQGFKHRGWNQTQQCHQLLNLGEEEANMKVSYKCVQDWLITVNFRGGYGIFLFDISDTSLIHKKVLFFWQIQLNFVTATHCLIFTLIYIFISLVFPNFLMLSPLVLPCCQSPEQPCPLAPIEN